MADQTTKVPFCERKGNSENHKARQANTSKGAAYVEVSVRDDNRAYVGTCGTGAPVQPFPTPGNLLVNGGYLKL
jgi:hypothetical protein